MTVAIQSDKRQFEIGTSGWSATNLNDSSFRAHWDIGHYEIVEGVLTIMAPAVFAGGESLGNLEFILRLYLAQKKIEARFSTEVELILDEMRVYRADLAVILPAEAHRIESVSTADAGWRDQPLRFPPSLIIESVSRGHERHDRVTKRRHYAEFGVPNYWILDAFEKSLECLVLKNSQYEQNAFGQGDAEIRPSLFPELVVPLKNVWGK
jgi:Uma2 family endonuclease